MSFVRTVSKALVAAELVAFVSIGLTAVPADTASGPKLEIGGRVVDASGSGIPDVELSRVEAVPPAREVARLLAGAEETVVGRAVTDDGGRYRLRPPRPGAYRVQAEAPGFAPVETAVLPVIDSLVLEDASLAAVRVTEIVVRGPDGEPLPEALVRLAPSGEGGPLSERPLWRPMTQWAVTDEQGACRLRRPSGHRVGMGVSHPRGGYRSLESVRGDALVVNLGDPGVEATMRVVDGAGTPQADALVGIGDEGQALGLTGSDGTLRFVVPVDEAFPLSVATPDGRTSSRRVGPLDPDPPSEPSKTPKIDLRIPSTSPSSVRVIDSSSGRGIPDAAVWPSAQPERLVRSDAGGTAQLATTDSATLDLRAGAPGFLPVTMRGVRPGSWTAPHLTVALDAAAAVSGRVVSGEGKPIPGARVTVEERREATGEVEIRIGGGFSPRPSAVTDELGRFRLGNLDPERRWRLVARADGWARGSLDLETLVPERPVRDLRLELERGHRAFGRVQDTEGRPITGARVVLRPRPDEGGRRLRVVRPGRHGEPAAETATAEEGRFRLGGLADGSYTLEVNAEGFARYEQPGPSFDGGEQEARDLGTVRLEPEAIVQGLVVDRSGGPIEGVAVTVQRGSEGPVFVMAGGAGGEPSVWTGPDGWFRVGGLRAGETVDLGFARRGYAKQQLPGVEAPSDQPLELTLEEASSVSGFVVDREGRGVADAEVQLNRNTAGGMGGRQFVMRTSFGEEADQDGGFVFEDQKPGEVDLVASAPGFREAKRSVTIPEGSDVEDLVLELEPGARIYGQVLHRDGSPAAGARVRVVEGGALPFGQGGTTADGAGRYVLDGLEEGTLSIEALSDGGLRTARDIEVESGAQRVDLELEGGRDVAGSVIGPGGAPVAGAVVRLSSGRNPWSASAETSDASGRFRFTGVREGEYVMRASHEDFAASERKPVSVADRPVEDLTVALRRGGSIEGWVRGVEPETLGEVSIEGFSRAGDDYRATRADREGRFSMDDVTPGAWSLRASVEGTGRQARAETEVEPGGGTSSVELVFGEGLTLRGRVTQATRPLKGASVALQGLNVSSNGWARTDHEGRFLIDGLRAGEYELMLREWESGLSYEETLTLDADDDITVEVPASRVRGIVLDAVDDAPLSGVRVRVQREGSPDAVGLPLGPGTTTDLDGRFSISPVGDGRWRVVASRDGYATTSRVVEIRGGEGPQELKLRMEPTEGLALAVRHETGALPERVTLAVLDPAGAPVAQGTYGTGEDGRVRVDGVPPGSWDVVVSGGGAATTSTRAQAPGSTTAVTLPPACGLRVVVLELKDSGTLGHATVRDDKGRPFRSIGWLGQVRSRWPVHAGQVLLNDLPPGNWEVVVTTPDGRAWSGQATTDPSSAPAVLTLGGTE